MNAAEKRQRVEAMATRGEFCEVCGKALTPGTIQGAHRIANTKFNRSRWGSYIIDHPLNIALVCSLACNHVCNIGYSEGDCLRLVQKIIQRELKRFPKVEER